MIDFLCEHRVKKPNHHLEPAVIPELAVVPFAHRDILFL